MGLSVTPGRDVRLTDRIPSAALLIGIAAAGAALASSAIPNHDVAWLWLATERLLDGGTLGGDVWELNPPLIFWIMSPAVIVAKLAGVDYHLAYSSWVALLATVSAFVCGGVVRPIFPERAQAQPFECWLLVCLLLLPGPHYGQREHLLIILAAPYLLWEACATNGDDASSRGPGLPISIAAAAGLLLKPHLAVLVAGFVGLRMLQARSLRPVLQPGYLAMLACAAIYGAAVFYYYPEWVTMTRLTSVVYSAYNPPPGNLIFLFEPLSILIAIAQMLLPRRGGWRTRLADPVQRLLFASVLLLVGALLQLKGWSYHKLPAGFALTLAASIFLLSPANARRSRVGEAVALGTIGLLLAKSTIFATYFQRSTSPHPEFARLVERANGGPIAAMSTNVYNVFPAIGETKGIWASRFPCQWLVPGAVKLARGDPRERREAERIRYIAAGLVAADIARYRPAVIALRTGVDQALTTPIDWIAFYRAHPRFREAWRDYCPSAPTANWAVYIRCADAESTS